MIDLLEDSDLLTLREASKILPCGRNGKKPHISTLWRWATHGLHGVKLETVRRGGTVYTSCAALRRFFSELSGPGLSDKPSPAAPHTSAVLRHELREHNLLSEVSQSPERGRLGGLNQ